MLPERVGDLLGCEHEAAGRVEQEVDRSVVRRRPDSAEHCLGVVDVDEAKEGDAQEAHRLLAVDHRDYTGSTGSLQCVERPQAPQLECPALCGGKQDRHEEQDREEIHAGRGYPP